MLSPRKRIRGRSDGGGDGVMAMGMMQSVRDGARGILISASSAVLYRARKYGQLNRHRSCLSKQTWVLMARTDASGNAAGGPWFKSSEEQD